jgi:hypothetical protein
LLHALVFALRLDSGFHLVDAEFLSDYVGGASLSASVSMMILKPSRWSCSMASGGLLDWIGHGQEARELPPMPTKTTV